MESRLENRDSSFGSSWADSSPSALLATGLLAAVKAVSPAIAGLKQIQKGSQEHLYRLASAKKVPSRGEIPLKRALNTFGTRTTAGRT